MADGRARRSPTAAVVAAVLIAVLTAALFWPAVRGEFVWDDRGLLGTDNGSVNEWWDVVTGFGRPVTANVGVGYYRPILTATLVADYQLGGADPKVFHRTNVLWHALNAAVVLMMLFVFTGDVAAAAVGAALFAVHPLQVQAVALVLGRNDELLLPPVAAMLVADELCERHGRRRLGAALIGLCYAVALYVKETAVIAPALVLLTDLAWRGRPLRELRARLPMLVIAGFVTVAYFASRVVVIGALTDGGQYGTLGPAGRLALAAATLGYYVHRLVLPWGLAPAPYHPGLVDPRHWELWAAAAWALAGCAVTVATLRRSPRVGYGLAFTLLASTPVLGILALMKVPMLEHRMYLPLLGVAFAAAGLLASRRWTAGIVVATGTVLAALAALTVARVPSYATAVALWEMGVRNAPLSSYARNNYGAALMEADRYPEAVEQLREALRLDPDYYRARYNLAGCLEYLGHRDEAIEHLEIIDAQHPDAAVENRLGLMRSRAGDLDKAREAFAKAAARSPDDVAIQRNFYDALVRQGQYADAVGPAERIAKLRPDVVESWWRLGFILRRAGRAAEAVPALERATRLAPPPGALELELAYALWDAGRAADAAAHAARARRLGASDPRFLQLLRDAGLLDAPAS